MPGPMTQTSVETLYRMSQQRYSVELRAGATGLRNPVSWVYLAEDVSNASFLKGGEIIITTGLFTQAGVTLEEFLEAMRGRDCSAVLVNIGPYLAEAQITDRIVALCEGAALPLLVMPWEVHLVDIMQEFSALLLQDRQRESSLDAAFEAALDRSPAPHSVLRRLDRYGYPAEGAYRVAVVHDLPVPARVRADLTRRGVRHHLFRHDNLHVLVHRLEEPGIRMEEVDALLSSGDGVSVGTSGAVDNLADLGDAFRRALFSLSVAELWQRPFVTFEELGMLQLLFCVSDQRVLEDLFETYLGALVAYDEEHDADLVRTLRTYLLADANLVETARRLPAHRNTVVHRMRRIREILGVDLNRATTKFNLLLALYIREYLSM